MKKTQLLLLFICCNAWVINAQLGCPTPQSAAALTANHITARINNGGDFFNNGSDAVFAYQPIAGHPSTIYSASIWMGGLDAGGNLKLAAMSYRLPNKTEFSAGPLDPLTGNTDVQTCSNWDIVFRTTHDRVITFKSNLANWIANPQAAIAQFPDIMGWPGKNNPHFNAVHGFDLPAGQVLAPFNDVDGDGFYNPLSGDTPAVALQGKTPFLPAELTWCVYNDAGAVHQMSNGAPIKMEIQLTAWAFDTTVAAPLGNTVFTSHKFIYRGAEPLDSFFVGVWADFDLGCYLDDYIGCDPASRTFYAYNQDAVDGSPGTTCNGLTTFGEETPVQSATFLDRPFDKFIYFNSPGVGNPVPFTTDPQTPAEHYNYLTGHWRDGSPIVPSLSDSISYAFPDDPSDPNGWSMCTANLPFADRRVIASTKIGALLPGAFNELTTAWTLHPDVPAPCNIGNTLADVGVVQDAFDNNFEGLSNTNDVQDASASNWVQASPNPTKNTFTLSFPERTVNAITCFDMQGRVVYSQQQQVNGMQQINTSTWPAGIYTVRLITDSEMHGLLLVVSSDK